MWALVGKKGVKCLLSMRQSGPVPAPRQRSETSLGIRQAQEEEGPRYRREAPRCSRPARSPRVKPWVGPFPPSEPTTYPLGSHLKHKPKPQAAGIRGKLNSQAVEPQSHLGEAGGAQGENLRIKLLTETGEESASKRQEQKATDSFTHSKNIQKTSKPKSCWEFI